MLPFGIICVMGEIHNFILDLETVQMLLHYLAGAVWKCCLKRLSVPEIALQYIMLNSNDLCFKFCLMLFVVFKFLLQTIRAIYGESWPFLFLISFIFGDNITVYKERTLLFLNP